jgi:hypothetical protein
MDFAACRHPPQDETKAEKCCSTERNSENQNEHLPCGHSAHLTVLPSNVSTARIRAGVGFPIAGDGPERGRDTGKLHLVAKARNIACATHVCYSFQQELLYDLR